MAEDVRIQRKRWLLTVVRGSSLVGLSLLSVESSSTWCVRRLWTRKREHGRIICRLISGLLLRAAQSGVDRLSVDPAQVSEETRQTIADLGLLDNGDSLCLTTPLSENRREHWNKTYSSSTSESTDEWLLTVLSQLNIGEGAKVLDLGCGSGANSEILLKMGYETTAVDISDEAIAKTRRRLPSIECECVDITLGLPFDEGSFDLVLADLVLHYFTMKTTLSIVDDIRRVLAPSGYLAARVNSDTDLLSGAGRGLEVEPGLFLYRGHYKRFFNSDSFLPIFRGFLVQSSGESTTHKYGQKKSTVEALLRVSDKTGTD